MKYSIATIALLGLALSNSLVSGKEGGFRLSQTTSKSLAGISSGLFLQQDDVVADDQASAAVVADDSAPVVADDSAPVAAPASSDDGSGTAVDTTVEAPASDSAAVVAPIVVTFEDLDLDAAMDLQMSDFSTVADVINNGLPVEFKSDDWIANVQAIIQGGADPTSLILNQNSGFAALDTSVLTLDSAPAFTLEDSTETTD